MWLTKNEKKVLKLLLDNAKLSDTSISKKLNISSQAIGKIRRKLESSIINSYTLEPNYARLGIHTFAIGIAKLTNEGMDQGELEVEQKLIKNPHIINVYRIPKGSSTHIIFYGFQDMNELDNFFHSQKLRQELHKSIETQELFVFSHNSLIKNTSAHLIKKVIDDMDNKKQTKFNEFENFKRRL